MMPVRFHRPNSPLPKPIKPSQAFIGSHPNNIPRTPTPPRPADNDDPLGSGIYSDHERYESGSWASISGLIVTETIVKPHQQGATVNPIAVYGKDESIPEFKIRQYKFQNGENGLIDEDEKGKLTVSGPHATDGTPYLLPDGRTVEGHDGFSLTRFSDGLIVEYHYESGRIRQSREKTSPSPSCGSPRTA